MTTKINQDQAELATETTAGIVERATDAEILIGTDTTRYVTPAWISNTIVQSGTLSENSAVAITSWVYNYTTWIQVTWYSIVNIIYFTERFSSTTAVLETSPDWITWTTIKTIDEGVGIDLFSSGSSSFTFMATPGLYVRAWVLSDDVSSYEASVQMTVQD